MAREVYTNEEFIKFSRKFIFMRVLEDQDPKGAALKEKFEVPGVPTLLIFDSRGRDVDRIVGGRSAGDLMDELEEIFGYASEDKPGKPFRI
jgi:thiol:disulfide interchange protein